MKQSLQHHYRQFGRSSFKVSSVGLGCWPIAGISSLDVNDQDSLRTIAAALDCGINFFDTAYSYGFNGQADLLLAKALKGRTGGTIVATKVGTHYDADGQRVVDGSPETLIRHAKESLDRLNRDSLDVLYLHTPDPNVPLEESADAIAELISSGIVMYAGVSNVNLQQLQLFHSRCPVTVVQPYFNMLQRDVVSELREFCQAEKISIACYWVLMKGLLAGRMQRDHQFDPADRRLTYAVYRGEAWQRAQDLLDELRSISKELNCTVAQLVVAWTIAQPGITVALCGAKRPEQITETAIAMSLELSGDILERINRLVDLQSSP